MIRNHLYIGEKVSNQNERHLHKIFYCMQVHSHKLLKSSNIYISKNNELKLQLLKQQPGKTVAQTFIFLQGLSS